MVNHVRTLLFNRTAASMGQGKLTYHLVSPSLPYLLGEVHIPPSFRPVEIPPHMASTYAALLSPTVGRAQRNYVVGCLMDLLHMADLDKYVRMLDPRITYQPGDIRYRQMFGSDVKVVRYGTGDIALQTLRKGDWTKFPLVGDMFTWAVSPTRNRVSVSDYLGRQMSGDIRFNDAGMSSTVELVPGYLQVKFRSASGGADLGKDKFCVGVTSVEPFDIAATVEALQFEVGRSPAASEFIFRPEGKHAAELALFKSLWDSWPDTAYQLAGITLAMAYRLDERS